MIYDYIIGIDPGKRGGISIYNVNKKTLKVHNMPLAMTELGDILEECVDKESHCFLELVHGQPGMGGAAMFTFGEAFGSIKTTLYYLKIPYTTVTPQKWQKTFQLGTKKEAGSPSLWKQKLKAKAIQLQPNAKFTLESADSVLICEYGKMQTLWNKS